jgi:hypothetical protein
MSSTTAATPSNHRALKASADHAGDMARRAFNEWLALHHRLSLLKMCERHAGYANLPLCITAKALASCRCKPIRECLATVVKIQRGLKKCEKEMKEWNKKEIELHRSYNDMAM